MTTDKNNAAPDLQPAELAERRGVALVTDAMVDAACKILHHGYDHESRKAYREACQKAARQALEAALAATGKQRVGEVQGDAVEHAKNLDLLRAGYHVDAEPRAAALNAAITALAARQPGEMSAEASQVARGMVAHCIEHRLCMGMDEGFASFDPHVEHPFVLELRGFADGAAPPAQGIDLGPLRALAEKFESYGDDEIGDAFSGPYYQCAAELRGLIEGQRDAAPGVGNG